MALNSNYYHGVQIRFGTYGLGSTSFGTAAIITNADDDNKITKTIVLDQRGTAISYVGSNPMDSATFTYVCATTATNDGNAPVYSPTQGTMFTVTDANPGGNNLIGTNWIADSWTQTQINTDVCRVTVKADRYFQITS